MVTPTRKPMFCYHGPITHCTGLVNASFRIASLNIETRKTPYEIDVYLDKDGYSVLYKRAGAYYRQFKTLFTRLPHPCDSRRDEDRFWKPIPWVDISHNEGMTSLYVPERIAEPVIDVLRTDSFFRLR